MSDELESVGALSTAALAAATLEGGHAGDSHGSHGHCANCRAALTGPFCRMCGQQAHIHRSLLHLLEEVLHGVFHFDAKGWRTIPLLIFKPGTLTRRYIDGQRKTYISPLAMFLFMVFLMFFVASLGGNGQRGSGMKAADAVIAIQNDITVQTQELTEARAAVDKAGAALEAAREQGGDFSEQQGDLDDALKDQKTADAVLQRLNEEAAKLAAAAKAVKEATKAEPQGKPATGATDATNATNSAASSAASSSGSPAAKSPAALEKPAGDITDSDATVPPSELQAAIEQVAREPGSKSADWTWVDRLAEKFKNKQWGHSDVPAIDEAIKHAVNNPELALYKLKNTTYKYSFMLVPISLPFLWLMFFWRRGIAMFDHAVFVLYSLCFMSLLFDGVMLVGMAGWGGLAATMAVFVPPVHMFVQLRGAYGLGIFSALWRTLALSIVATIVMVLFMLLVLVLSMH